MSEQLTFHETWSTDKEIEFLAALGSHRPATRTPPDRLLLLMNYLESMIFRLKWDKIDPGKIAAAVGLMIEDERDKRATLALSKIAAASSNVDCIGRDPRAGEFALTNCV